MKRPTTRKLLAKAIRTHHAFPVEHDRQRYAVPLGNGQFALHDGKHERITTITPGDFVEGLGRIESAGRHGLIGGGKTILVAKQLLANTEARETKTGGVYHVRFPNGTLGELTVGTEDPEWGFINARDHLLCTARGEFPIVPKQYEQTLLVFDNREGDGYLAYLNTIEPRHANNRKDGLMGSFVPASNKKAAIFAQSVEGKNVVIAMFYPGGSRRKCTVFQRDRSLALRISEAELRLKAVEADASIIGVAPEDIQGHAEAAQALLELNGAGWQRNTFNIAQGHDLFQSEMASDFERAV